VSDKLVVRGMGLCELFPKYIASCPLFIDLERLVEQLDSDMINSGLVVDTSGLDELNDEVRV